jgi:hypothetical protein
VTATPPEALDWHPWYRDKTWLLEWLESTDFDRLLVPVSRRARYREFNADGPITPVSRNHVELTKRVAFGPAPYVGEPFRYVWHAATDQYGRSIAGPSRVVYDL